MGEIIKSNNRKNTINISDLTQMWAIKIRKTREQNCRQSPELWFQDGREGREGPINSGEEYCNLMMIVG